MSIAAPTPMMTLAQAAQWLSSARLIGDPATAIFRVHSDTRTVETGDLFVALEGDKFNANHFLHDAKRLGPRRWQRSKDFRLPEKSPLNEQIL